MPTTIDRKPRIAPLNEPWEPDTAAMLTSMMPAGVPPIALYRTFAHNLPMADAMRGWGGYELGKTLSLDMRTREIVIDRVSARCGCEYEWGVHVAFFAERVGLDREQIRSLTHGNADDGCWTAERDRLAIRVVDALHDESTVDDALWAATSAKFRAAEILDLTMLTGWYHAISFTARTAEVPLEDGAPSFEDYR